MRLVREQNHYHYLENMVIYCHWTCQRAKSQGSTPYFCLNYIFFKTIKLFCRTCNGMV